MNGSEMELVDAARAARPHLHALVERDSAGVDQRLGELIAQADRGTSVELALLDLFSEHAELRRFVSDFLAAPVALRSYQPLPGHHDAPSAVPRYLCSEHSTSAYRFSAADPEPVCPVDGGPMVRVS